MYVCMYVCVCARALAYVRAYVRACVRTYVLVRVCVYSYKLIAGMDPTGGHSKTRVHGIWFRKIRVPGLFWVYFLILRNQIP